MNNKKKKKQLMSNKKANSSSKNKKVTINKYIPKTISEIVLTVLFIVLLVVVIILGVKAFNLKKEQNTKKDVDLTVPILETKTNNTFSVDLSKMKNQEIKEYKFMITNYKDKQIANKDINYKIELTSHADAISIKLYKNREEDNLLTDTTSTHSIENNKLPKDKKTSDTYYLIIRAKDEIKEKDNIEIKISTTN